jgi:hypothetical protein
MTIVVLDCRGLVLTPPAWEMPKLFLSGSRWNSHPARNQMFRKIIHLNCLRPNAQPFLSFGLQTLIMDRFTARDFVNLSRTFVSLLVHFNPLLPYRGDPRGDCQ